MEELRYDTRLGRVSIFGAIFCFSTFCMLFASSLLPLLIFVSLGSGLGLYSSVVAYKKLLLYPDRIVMTDFFNKLQWEIYYTDISHAGFLNGQDVFGNKYTSNEFQTEILIILCNNKFSVQLDGNDFDEIHEICAYIEHKITPE